MQTRRFLLRSGGALCALLGSSQAQAAGFHIDEQDARATGRAGAVIASASNPSAIYYNPAGLAELEGLQATLGAALVSPVASFTGSDGAAEVATEERRFVLPQVFVAAKVAPWLAVGLGFYAPFGLGIHWPDSSPARAEIVSAELQAPFVTPAVAVDLSTWLPGLALGGGLDLVPANVRLERDIFFGTDLGSVALGGDALGAGARLGLSYRSDALPLSVGLTWRSGVDLDFSGNADFDAPPNYRAALPPDGDVSTSIALPSSLGFGVAVRPLPSWELEVDMNRYRWSSYDQLVINLPEGNQTVSRRDWENTTTVRVGTEVAFAESWAARLGFIWDQTPIPSDRLDFQLPDADRFDVTAGFGGEVAQGVRIDLSGLYVLPQSRQTASEDPLEPPIKGQFEIAAWVTSLTVGGTFGAPPSRPVTLAVPGAARP